MKNIKDYIAFAINKGEFSIKEMSWLEVIGVFENEVTFCYKGTDFNVNLSELLISKEFIIAIANGRIKSKNIKWCKHEEVYYTWLNMSKINTWVSIEEIIDGVTIEHGFALRDKNLKSLLFFVK